MVLSRIWRLRKGSSTLPLLVGSLKAANGAAAATAGDLQAHRLPPLPEFDRDREEPVSGVDRLDLPLTAVCEDETLEDEDVVEVDMRLVSSLSFIFNSVSHRLVVKKSYRQNGLTFEGRSEYWTP